MKRDTNSSAQAECSERQEFRRRVERFQRSIFSFLSRFGFRAEITEELAQDTFLRAWRARDTVDPDKGAYSTWLFRIARNVAITEIERSKRVVELHGFENAEHIATPDTTQASAEFDQALTQLRLAIQNLSAREREAIALACVQELSMQEAALVAGCTEGTFRTRLSRARQRLLSNWNQHD